MAEPDQDTALEALAAGRVAGMATGEVTRIDTHSAIIFLAGEQAYKVKRAVKFPYLDFSTLALRQDYCRREVELNRRTAPTLYDGVEPLVRDGDDWSLGGDGDPVEWVIVMRRFSQDHLFDAIAEAAKLDAALLRRAVDMIADFHHDAAPTPDAADLTWVVEENLEELRASPALFPPAEVEPYAETSLALFERLRPLLAERHRAGFVRHGHGDLHLHNICLLDGEPVLFDAIEFNDRLACADVLYDFSFLLMDLVHRDLPALANQALSRYVADANTARALAALNLFCSLRAAIRAKVGVPALETATDQDAAKAEIAAYFALARKFMEPVAPRLVAVGGLSGTGKTTLAAALAPRLGGPLGALHLRTDVIRKRLAGVADDETLPKESYTREASEKVYAELMRLADAALSAGWPVVVDAVFLDAGERRAVADLAAKHGARFDGLWLTAPTGTLKQRVDARTGDASDATSDVVELQAGHAQPVDDWPHIDAGAGPDATAAAAREHLH
ncbi:MAG: AAA family ATPase [Alphaproteobacteria bacterium]